MKPLTRRQVEILDCMVAGNTSHKEIAAALHISRNTVKNHMSNLCAALGAKDMVHAVLIALRSGIVSFDERRSA